MKTQIEYGTVVLNSGITVLAKRHKGEFYAIGYSNRTQAIKAAERIGGTVRGMRSEAAE